MKNSKIVKNPLSINYNVEKLKLDNMNNKSKIKFDDSIFELKKSKDCFLMFNRSKEKIYVYNSLKKNVITKKKNMDINHCQIIR